MNPQVLELTSAITMNHDPTAPPFTCPANRAVLLLQQASLPTVTPRVLNLNPQGHQVLDRSLGRLLGPATSTPSLPDRFLPLSAS